MAKALEVTTKYTLDGVFISEEVTGTCDHDPNEWFAKELAKMIMNGELKIGS